MNEKIKKFKNTTTAFWTDRTKSQKRIFIGTMIIIVLLITAILLFAFHSKFVPLYNNLSVQEAGQIKAELDTRGVPYELQENGTTILVPDEQVDSLLVDLAGQGIPNSGNIDYSFFSENASWGVTENEFNVMKLDAMQTELANLMKGIDGINDAQVMINMPEEAVFVNDTQQNASASIVLNTKPGYQFQEGQINGLYHMVSKAVPNLPIENIAITNQYFESFEPGNTTGNVQDTYTYQQQVKQDIEQDIQKRLQQMLGAMVGLENVIVSVTSDIDFTQENRTEEIVDPVDLENMEGLPVSIETIQETYTGDGAAAAGSPADEGDIQTFQGTDEEDNGEYEMVKETINNEFNRIRKNIVESPYKVRDLGIQVAVNAVKNENGSEVEYLTQQEEATVEEGMNSIMNSIITTSIDREYVENIEPEEKVSIVFQEFTGKQTASSATTPVIPAWVYIVGGIVLLAIIILVIKLLRNRKAEEVEEEIDSEEPINVPNIPEKEESESMVRKRQLEKVAKEKPEDFAKLLRSWIGED
ncbi:flagellar basal-body MS-ring/collar protein FliF [Virgibacillus salexigens]|uniref:Flagellar M-ring protein n=1 Tax=Virgibacillus kapii TaxID=1638645 RepID=A0ABQ2D365_9BACI|nr:flagellar basal-body MS-ring/collar protein FliF [Virgibacillus kapii]GGJ44041.1 flagellar M-ring protein [Virgibacillus kapii]